VSLIEIHLSSTAYLIILLLYAHFSLTYSSDSEVTAFLYKLSITAVVPRAQPTSYHHVNQHLVCLVTIVFN